MESINNFTCDSFQINFRWNWGIVNFLSLTFRSNSFRL